MVTNAQCSTYKAPWVLPQRIPAPTPPAKVPWAPSTPAVAQAQGVPRGWQGYLDWTAEVSCSMPEAAHCE